MKSKPLNIVLDVVASIVVLIISFVVLGELGGAIFGTTKDGYGKYNAGAFYALILAITIAFGIWFYKFLSRKSKVQK